MSSHGTNAQGRGRMSLRSEMKERTGRNTSRCYQCGKCSAGCPMASETSLRPHDVMRLVNNDARERLLADESIWLCLAARTAATRPGRSTRSARWPGGSKSTFASWPTGRGWKGPPAATA